MQERIRIESEKAVQIEMDKLRAELFKCRKTLTQRDREILFLQQEISCASEKIAHFMQLPSLT